MPDIQLPGIRLYVEIHGVGPPILCIHGTSGSAMAWESSFPQLMDLGRVIAYDRRGCTRSERPDPYDSTTLSEQAGDAKALLDGVTTEPAVIIGRSYGGSVALELALNYPDKVRGLVLLEPAIVSLSDEVRAWSTELATDIFAAAEGKRGDVARCLLTKVLGQDGWDNLPDSLKRMFIDNEPAILAETRGGELDIARDRLSTIAVPVLLVAASDSPPAFRSMVEDLDQVLPDSRVCYVGGGHLVNPSDPIVLAFLSEMLARQHVAT